ncbi:uncharacterized protein [Antedon mediterranea]|uniref:uncharacterized protein n=1 Tax=Antedon mediterranea TaxID=105859 RepID=UPI003AF472E7
MVKTTVCTPDASNKEMLKETTQDISLDMYQDAVTDVTVKKMLKSPRHTKGYTQRAGTSQQETKSDSRPEKEKNPTGASTSKQEAKFAETSTSSNPMPSPQKEKPVYEEKPEIPKGFRNKFVSKLRSAREDGDLKVDSNKFVMHIWDFGGQPIYHVIQRIFMVSYAVVCVVFNMNEGLNAPAKVRDPTTGKVYEHRMTNLDFILFWIRSVFVNVRKGKNNKIMLIGTHYESLGKTEQERQQRVKEIENILWKALEGKPFEDMVYQGELFTIENSVSFEKSGASKIILQIQKLVQMMILTFPIKWLQVLLEIQQLRKAKLYLPTSEINDLLARCKITDRKLFLEYLHDIGEILFYPDDKILKEKIVIDLMGVVDKFKTIITVIDPSIQPSLKQLWRNLNGGKLDERLLQHIWKDESDEMIIFFVSLMQTFGLMCEKRSKENVGRMFYVLSRLKPQRDDTKAAEYEEKHAISLFHDFDGYLPDDLFQRVATKFIEEFQIDDVEPALSYEHVELNVDGHHLVLLNVATINNRRLFQTTIVRTTIMNTESGSSSPEDDDPQPSICKKVLSFLQKELHFLSERNAHGVKVKMYIPCVCASKGEPTHMHVVRKFDKDVLPCGSRGMEVKRYRNLFGDNVLSKEESIEDKYVNNIDYVDDLTIESVSTEMDLSCRRFGVRLGLTWSTVNTIFDNEKQTDKATANMLKRWRSSIGSDFNQQQVLCTALRQHDRNDLADLLFQKYIDDEIPKVIKPSARFDDQDLLFICDNLGQHWRRLAVRLGIKWDVISNITGKNRHDEDDIMVVLVKWRGRQRAAHQIPTMIKALKQQGRVDLADSLCTRHEYKDDVSSEVPMFTDQSGQGCLTDLDFLIISLKMTEWKSFCRGLGIADVELTQNEIKYLMLTVEATMESLVQWRCKQGRDVNQRDEVIKALRAVKRMDIVQLLETVY